MTFGVNKTKAPNREELISSCVNFADLISAVSSFYEEGSWSEAGTEYQLKNSIALCVHSIRELCAFLNMDDFDIEKRIRYLLNKEENSNDK